MAKIKILKSIIEGFKIPVRNPAIFIPAFFFAVLGSFTSILFGSVPEPTETISREIVAYLIFFMIWFAILTLVGIFLTSVIIRMVYGMTTGKASLFESAKIAVLKYPTLLISCIICFFVVCFGFFALIIPGIFLSIKFLYYQYAILLDDEGVINSLKKSWKITDGNWWTTLFILTFFSLLSIAIFFMSAILSVIFEVLNLPVSSLIDFATNLFVLPWMISSLTFAYLQITDRDLQ